MPLCSVRSQTLRLYLLQEGASLRRRWAVESESVESIDCSMSMSMTALCLYGHKGSRLETCFHRQPYNLTHFVNQTTNRTQDGFTSASLFENPLCRLLLPSASSLTLFPLLTFNKHYCYSKYLKVTVISLKMRKCNNLCLNKNKIGSEAKPRVKKTVPVPSCKNRWACRGEDSSLEHCISMGDNESNGGRQGTNMRILH